MKEIIILLVDLMIWGAVLGSPFSDLFYYPGFWCLGVGIPIVIVLLFNIDSDGNRPICSILAGILLLGYLVYWGLLIFSESVRNSSLTLIGMEDYIQAFDRVKISFWRYLLAALISYIPTTLINMLYTKVE